MSHKISQFDSFEIEFCRCNRLSCIRTLLAISRVGDNTAHRSPIMATAAASR